MKRRINVKDLFYFFGLITFSFGLFFYSNVIVSDGVLGLVSEYMIKKTSTYYIYTGFVLMAIGLLVTKDLYRFYQWCVYKLPKDVMLYLSIIFAGALYLMTVFTPAIYAHFCTQLVMITMTIYLAIKLNWMYLLGIFVVILNVVESYIFLYEIDYFFTSFDQLGLIISSFIMTLHIVYIIYLVRTYYLKKQSKTNFGILIWSFSMSISVYLLNPLGYSRVYTFSEMTNESSSSIIFTDVALFSNLFLSLLLGTIVYLFTKRKDVPSIAQTSNQSKHTVD